MGVPHVFRKQKSILALVFLWVISTPALIQAGEERQVIFGDLDLETAVRQAISKPVGEIRSADVSGLQQLEAVGKSIFNLAGVERLISLNRLGLADNQVRDLSPLLRLAQAQQAARDADFDRSGIVGFSDFSLFAGAFGSNDSWYDLNGNGQVDFSDFRLFVSVFGRSVLTALNLSGNQISDLSPLSELTSLVYLDLSNNAIGDVSPLRDLESLIELNLQNNPFNDISALKHLTALERLNLGMGCNASGCHPDAPNARFKVATGNLFHPLFRGR